MNTLVLIIAQALHIFFQYSSHTFVLPYTSHSTIQLAIFHFWNDDPLCPDLIRMVPPRGVLAGPFPIPSWATTQVSFSKNYGGGKAIIEFDEFIYSAASRITNHMYDVVSIFPGSIGIQ